MAADLSALESSNIWSAIADANSEVAWAVCGFAEDPRKPVVQATGAGPLEETLAALKDDQVQFVGLRVTAIDKKGARTRYILAWRAGYSRYSRQVRLQHAV
jgi:hypothetical protein